MHHDNVHVSIPSQGQRPARPDRDHVDLDTQPLLEGGEQHIQQTGIGRARRRRQPESFLRAGIPTQRSPQEQEGKPGREEKTRLAEDRRLSNECPHISIGSQGRLASQTFRIISGHPRNRSRQTARPRTSHPSAVGSSADATGNTTTRMGSHRNG